MKWSILVVHQQRNEHEMSNQLLQAAKAHGEDGRNFLGYATATDDIWIRERMTDNDASNKALVEAWTSGFNSAKGY